MNSMVWGQIEANRELPLSWFSPPEYPQNVLKRFLEQLYMQRTDSQAFMWSYVDFRWAHPEWNTRPGVEFIGYQMQKMSNAASAIVLLEANARDYPHASSAAFELGRAYSSAGKEDDARWNYERALLLNPDDDRAAAALAAMD